MTVGDLVEQRHADAKTLPEWAEAEAPDLKRRRLDGDCMNVIALVAYVLGTVLIDKAVQALQKAAA